MNDLSETVTMNADTLAELSAAYGIAAAYEDIWRRRHSVSPQTQQALLAAMGVAANDDSARQRALAVHRQRAWARWLEPVQVVPHGVAPIEIAITLEAHLQGEFDWRLALETGEELHGRDTLRGLSVCARTEVAGQPYARYRFILPVMPTLGYHRFRMRIDAIEHETVLIVVPSACYVPPHLAQGGRAWGFALQLYALRSTRNWGIGDFTDLRRMVEGAAELGAHTLGINPLHLLFRHNPEQASPYSPASRLALNVLYIDVEAVPEFAHVGAVDAAQAEHLAALRANAYVDYSAVAQSKWAVFERLYAQFRAHDLLASTARAKAFQLFVLEQGAALMRVALYQALQEHLQRLDANAWGWPVWPAAYRDPDAPAVQEFFVTQRERIEFYLYLQWLADTQLGACAQRAQECAMGVGLYRDLAVGVDRAGADAWVYQKMYAHAASIGCPPDDFSLEGQDWGLPPMIPDALREVAYEPFIATLRANMRHAGALRIDHVMGLMRLFWIPAGESARAGAYVDYPLDDLLGILALESQRHRCLVIGEDLGTVPAEIRTAMQRLGVLSYRLLYFQRDAASGFIAPTEYPEQALVAVSTHDLATLAGYWQQTDIDERARLGLFPSVEIEQQQRAQRVIDRERLIAALVHAQLLPENAAVPDTATPELVRAVHAFLARSPAKMMLVQAEDLIGQAVAVNLPGTDRERPNWRLKLPIDVETFLRDADVRAACDVLQEARSRT